MTAEPTIRKASTDDHAGTVGMAEDGTIQRVLASKKDPSKKTLDWISDCAVYIDTETSANNVTEFTFKGKGAKDHREVCFTLPADSLEDRKFKAALINEFGAANQVGKLNFEIVQKLSLNTRVIKRVEVPAWDGNIPLVPGVGMVKDVEFKLSPMTPANVYDGDLQTAKDRLITLLKTHPYAPIVVTTILGAPAVARWMPDERIGLALWGLTGTIKTTFLQTCMTMYGREYASDRYLLKHGKGGTTLVAALEVMAAAGILAQILDNVKAVEVKDHQLYVSIIQAVIEGADKQRGKKDGGLKASQIFRCTPLISGEIRPEEASTDARVLNLPWSKPNLELLTEIQHCVDEMPIIGYHWLRFLAETDLNLNDGFSDARCKKESEFSRVDNVNAGRLASIYTVLKCTWDLLCKSPFGDVFQEATEDFNKGLEMAIEDQRNIVNGDTEVAKFLAGIDELQASQPGLFLSGANKTAFDKEVIPRSPSNRIIGKHTDEGLFLLPYETLEELGKMKIFTQIPTVDSMTKALHAAHKLVIDEDGTHIQVQRRINHERPRGWLLSPNAFQETPVKIASGDTKNSNSKPFDSTDSTVSSENTKSNFKEEIKVINHDK